MKDLKTLLIESIKNEPDKNYFTSEYLKDWYIPKAEQQIVFFKKIEIEIDNCNKYGADIYGEKFCIGDLVECTWSNGAVRYGIIKEFGATFEGRIFPIMYECKKDMTPKKSILSATSLNKEMLKIKKINNS